MHSKESDYVMPVELLINLSLRIFSTLKRIYCDLANLSVQASEWLILGSSLHYYRVAFPLHWQNVTFLDFTLSTQNLHELTDIEEVTKFVPVPSNFNSANDTDYENKNNNNNKPEVNTFPKHWFTIAFMRIFLRIKSKFYVVLGRLTSTLFILCRNNLPHYDLKEMRKAQPLTPGAQVPVREITPLKNHSVSQNHFVAIAQNSNYEKFSVEP